MHFLPIVVRKYRNVSDEIPYNSIPGNSKIQICSKKKNYTKRNKIEYRPMGKG